MRIALIALLVGWFSAQAQDWKPLFDGKTLAGWKATGFGGAGEVEVSDGALVLNMGMLTGVNYTNPVPNVNYEVEFEARRVVGSDFFAGLTFPVRDSFATLIAGGWGGSTIGISSLDGNDAAHNETTSYRRFEAGRWYKFRLSVTAANLSLWLDGEQLINADIRSKKISLRPGDIELSKPFGFASYSTTAELRGIRLRAPASSTPAAATAPAPAAVPAAPPLK